MLAAYLALALCAGGQNHEAERAFQLGLSSYGAGHFSEALGQFAKAYALVPLPELLYDMGQCQRGLGQWNEAAKAYRRYLDAEPRGKFSEKAKAHLAEVQLRIQEALAAAPPSKTEPPPAAADVPPAQVLVMAPAPPPAAAAPAAQPAGNEVVSLTASASPPAKHGVSSGPLWTGGAGLALALLGGGALVAGEVMLGPTSCHNGATGDCFSSSVSAQAPANALGYAGQAGLIAGGAILIGAATWAIVQLASP